MQVVQVMRVLHVVLALLAARGCDARELRFAADMQAVALAGQRAGSSRKLELGGSQAIALPAAISQSGDPPCPGHAHCWVVQPWFFGAGRDKYWVTGGQRNCQFLATFASFDVLRAAGARLACATGPLHLQLEPVPDDCMADNPGGYPRTCGCPARDRPGRHQHTSRSLRILLPASALIVAVELQPQVGTAAEAIERVAL